jgi:hypothetical protein
MDITTRLQLLESIRRADQADTAHTAAERAVRKATADVCRSLEDIAGLEQKLTESADRSERTRLGAALDGARETYADFGRRKQAAHEKQCRARVAAQVHADAWNTLHAAHASDSAERPRASVKADLLNELTAMPLELVRAADALLVQSSAGKDSSVMLHRVATWAAAVGCLDKVVVVHCDLDE